MKKFNHKFRGNKYLIQFTNRLSKVIFGDCDSPYSKERKIRIRKDLDDEKLLEISIHEALHACFFDIDDSVITETAKDISEFLIKLGYTRKLNKGGSFGEEKSES